MGTFFVVAGEIFRIKTGLAGMEKYLQSCKSDFWKEVFEAELEYILRQLRGVKDVLSVGCGPAIIEAGLAERQKQRAEPASRIPAPQHQVEEIGDRRIVGGDAQVFRFLKRFPRGLNAFRQKYARKQVLREVLRFRPSTLIPFGQNTGIVRDGTRRIARKEVILFAGRDRQIGERLAEGHEERPAETLHFLAEVC